MDATPSPERRVTASRTAKRCLISGRVQGVYYRASAANKARELQIDGYARNLDDGRVEVFACGEPADVQSFLRWLWVGPSAAKVTEVDVECADASAAAGFAVR